MSTAAPPRLLPLGDGAVIVQFGDEIGPETHARVLGFVQALAAARAAGGFAGVREWVPAFTTVTLVCDESDETSAAERDAALLALAREAQRVSRQNFEDEVRHFIAALHSGAIQPIDF